MTKFDVLDEVVINAKPDVVWKAILYSGAFLRGMGAEFKLLEGSNSHEVGALTEITLPSKFAVKFISKTVEIKENELWRVQYVGGVFRGEGLWRFEPIDGNTKVSFHWRVRPSGLLSRFLAIFINIPKRHSAVMKKAFASLNEYINEQDVK